MMYQEGSMELRAVIFDLDGVITDTAEYHYRAWQRMADEEGFPFNREVNEKLRGVSRRASLEIILAGRKLPEEKMAELMERKNSYYVAMLDQITPADLLPGAVPLLEELRAAGIKTALGSASKNARPALDRLGIAALFDAVADGYSVQRTKPAPDLFLKAAEMLGVPPAFCAVVEDAAAGIDAALAAGTWAIGLGPAERVGHAHVRFDSLDGVTLAAIQAGLAEAEWLVVEPAFDPARQYHRETIFTIGNGDHCVRGALEEGYPADMPAGFIHRLWDDMPINFTELANIPRWWGVDVWVDGERFRLDRGAIQGYRRQLNLRNGVLSRTVRWRPRADGTGPLVELHFERFVSMAEQHLGAVRLRVTALEGEFELRVRAGFDAYVENTGLLHWRLIDQSAGLDGVQLRTRTRATGAELALAAEVGTSEVSTSEVGVSGGASQAGALQATATCDTDGQPMLERRVRLTKGASATLDKFVGFAVSIDDEDPARTAASTASAAHSEGYEAILADSAAEWAKLWHTSDVIVEGDHEAQLALRFNIFQLLIAAPRYTERASIGAKTLSGFGYRHHVFWDTEIFMLPLFVYTQPALARNMLMYRYHNLPGAREKAASNGFDGAQFPWESGGTGREVTPSWVQNAAKPNELVHIWTGDIEIHITADIAYAAMLYWRVTGDDAWLRDYGAEMLVDGAKFWGSAAHAEADGKYHFRNVIGPDENHDRIDDNAYTNTMAKWHLETALDVLAWLHREYPDRHAALVATLDLSEARLAHWADVIGCMFVPGDPESDLIEQFNGYFDLQDADFDALRDPNRTRSIQAILGIEGAAATQVLKQPDVLMLQYLLPNRFTPEQVAANYAYYSPRTDHEHGSSLGPSISAIMSSRVGDDAAAYEHFMRAARADLVDVRHNAGDGIHGASAGGLWQAAVFGFGGLRVNPDAWETHPLLPAGWTRLAFKFYHRGELQSVDIH
jgi:beta-phosphoglucomutase